MDYHCLWLTAEPPTLSSFSSLCNLKIHIGLRPDTTRLNHPILQFCISFSKQVSQASPSYIPFSKWNTNMPQTPFPLTFNITVHVNHSPSSGFNPHSRDAGQLCNFTLCLCIDECTRTRANTHTFIRVHMHTCKRALLSSTCICHRHQEYHRDSNWGLQLLQKG